MDERNYPGKVEVEMPLQLKTESPANQVVIKVPLIKSNNIFSFLEKEWGRTFYQSGLWCKKKKKTVTMAWKKQLLKIQRTTFLQIS